MKNTVVPGSKNPSLVHVGDCSCLEREITYCWRVFGGSNRNNKSQGTFYTYYKSLNYLLLIV